MIDCNADIQKEEGIKGAMLLAFNNLGLRTLEPTSPSQFKPERIGQSILRAKRVICEDRTARNHGHCEEKKDIEVSFGSAVEKTDKKDQESSAPYNNKTTGYCSVTTQVNDYIYKRREQGEDDFEPPIDA